MGKIYKKYRNFFVCSRLCHHKKVHRVMMPLELLYGSILLPSIFFVFLNAKVNFSLYLSIFTHMLMVHNIIFREIIKAVFTWLKTMQNEKIKRPCPPVWTELHMYSLHMLLNSDAYRTDDCIKYETEPAGTVSFPSIPPSFFMFSDLHDTLWKSELLLGD